MAMIAAGLALTLGGASAAAEERPTPDLKAGAAAYQRSCARCHGAAGHGDGMDAKRFYPRPRDLTMGVYKFRSTASGTPPTDDDLFQTITSGLPGTNMPDWPHLDEATRWQLVYYLKSLSPVFEQHAPTPVTSAPDPGPKRADLQKGRAVFEQLGCAACHGAHGRANGTSAAGLVDDWGLPIRPANLTKGWAYRGGQSPAAIVTRIVAGIDGAGMPSYAEAVSPEDAWHLAYYVASLQEPAHWNLIIHPLHLEQGARAAATALTAPPGVPSTVDDPRWARAEPTDVRVRNAVTSEGEWARPPTVTAVSIRAVEDGQAISFLLTWDDPTEETGARADRAALVFSLQPLQADAVSLQAWPYAEAPRLDVCYWSAGSGKAFETLPQSFDTLFVKGNRRAPRDSAAAYADGRWRLVIQRPLKPEEPEDAAQLSDELFGQVAVAVWDGGNPDARAVSPWADVALRRMHSTKAHR